MPGDGMTLGELYTYLLDQTPSSFEARQLFAFVTGLKVSDLPLRREEVVPPQQSKHCKDLCRRRLLGEPLQYLLQEWEFYGLPFSVGPGVLIPRADTELLVDVAIEEIRGINSPEVLDLCSGTGCIAIAVASCIPEAKVTALELAEDAFDYLVGNCQRHGNRVRPIQGDIQQYIHPTKATLITANPPYIPQSEMGTLQREVLHEPASALFGGEDGLDFYHIIASRYYHQLAEGGSLCLEVGIHQSGPVADLLSQNRFQDIQIYKDLCGIERVVTAKRIERQD